MNIKIKKASGLIEEFNPSKLRDSLMRAGAERDDADQVIEKVMADIKPFTSTRKIFRLAHKYLRKFNRSSVLRYSLKEALMRLGPTGYPFEKYVGELLRQQGYKVDVGLIMEGTCVTHEVDIFARRDNEIVLVECKYRNRSDNAPDVKTAMYFHSRFRDLHSGMKSENPGKSFSGWLMTNTRFTSDALQYGSCSNLKLVSWKYPEKKSLEFMIEENKLYPVTVMTGLTALQTKKLFKHNIILMKDLAERKPVELKRLLSITEKRAAGMKEAAEKLCFC